MTDPLAQLDRYLLITADSHAGSSPEGYGPYLEKKWKNDYDEWVVQSHQIAKITREVMGNRSIGVDGDPDTEGNRNWDSARRLRETEADGVVGEVIFPNTSPPFAPNMMSEFGEAEIGTDHARRWAGIKAHNRWLADYCSQEPERRAGIAQIFLPYIEESVEEIRWAKENGLRGGILLPGAPPGSGLKPLYSPEYEPIFATCEELGLPINHHSGGSSPDFGNYLPQSLAMYMLEVQWWTYRSLWHLIFSGVFERHPNLQFALTETGIGWVPGVLKTLDNFYLRMKTNDQCAEHIFGAPTVARLSLKPSEYFERQCHIGASFLPPAECALRDQIGTAKVMWGSDYPHVEGSHPFTREHLRHSFAGVGPDEIQQMVGRNTAALYDFDLEKLAPLAARFGPTKEEVAKPLDLTTLPREAQKCPAFSSLDLVPIVDGAMAS